jgi:hypothetical protein
LPDPLIPVMMTNSAACLPSCAMTGGFFFPLRGGFPRFAGAADFRGFMHWIVASEAPELGEMNGSVARSLKCSAFPFVIFRFVQGALRQVS